MGPPCCWRCFSYAIDLTLWLRCSANIPLVFFLPWLVITKLELKTSVKIVAYCTLFLGLLTVGLAVLPFVAIETAPNKNQVSTSLLGMFAQYRFSQLSASNQAN